MNFINNTERYGGGRAILFIQYETCFNENRQFEEFARSILVKVVSLSHLFVQQKMATFEWVLLRCIL